MSIFRCNCCDFEFDSDYHEILKWDGDDVCEDCYLDCVKVGELNGN